MSMQALLFPQFLTSSPPLPSALQCQDLAPNKAHVNCSHPFGAFRYQSTCSLTCDEGFLLVGARELQCLDTGHWSAPLPECRGKNYSLQRFGNSCKLYFKRLHFRGGNCLGARNLKWTGKLITSFIHNPGIPNADAFRA